MHLSCFMVGINQLFLVRWYFVCVCVCVCVCGGGGGGGGGGLKNRFGIDIVNLLSFVYILHMKENDPINFAPRCSLLLYISLYSSHSPYPIRKINRHQREPLVSDPGMHHGTCVTHLPRCMSGTLTRDRREIPSRHSRCVHNPHFFFGKRPMP